MTFKSIQENMTIMRQYIFDKTFVNSIVKFKCDVKGDISVTTFNAILLL